MACGDGSVGESDRSGGSLAGSAGDVNGPSVGAGGSNGSMGGAAGSMTLGGADGSSSPDIADAASSDAEPPVICATNGLPEPAPESTFYILPIWEEIRWETDDVVGREMDKLILQVGKGNRYHRTGFSSIKPPASVLARNCKLALQKGLSIGVIFGGITHDRPDLVKIWNQDLRTYQWRMNGTNWQGYYTGTNNGGGLEIAEDTRDHLVPTASRYADLVESTYAAETHRDAKEMAAVMQEYPGCVVVLNGVIEEEFAVASAQQSDAYLGDYSPFAVTEFRDWLRHTGKYDAAGPYAGQGAPAAITGPYASIGGTMRSPFADDPSPSDAHGTGSSFNQSFGTSFATWTLRHWDTTAFPAAITNAAFNPSPETGTGFTSGGFDAPRTRDGSTFWKAWSWDYDDRGNTYPPGNPSQPAWGFRQNEIHNWVLDQFAIMVEESLPRDLMFPHQIPGERLGGFTGGSSRCRSSASPVWTGFIPWNGNVGITLFNGPMSYDTIKQYTDLVPRSRNWGIFEWHPLPNALPQDQKLYDAAKSHLLSYYDEKVHYLFPGWWNKDGAMDKTFPLNDSLFALAIKDFLASRPDKPYPGYHCP